jgi:hypothetical protein
MKIKKNRSGIYVIKSTKHFYIGLSSNLLIRKVQHFSKLRNNVHTNIKLQRIYNKGYKLEFEVLEECLVDLLNENEIK